MTDKPDTAADIRPCERVPVERQRWCLPESRGIIIVEGFDHEVLAGLHNQSTIIAERSFVDHWRLDIEATVAEGLADTNIVFDLHLAIPNRTNLDVFLANGPVEVIDVNGNVEIRTANGAVVVD